MSDPVKKYLPLPPKNIIEKQIRMAYFIVLPWLPHLWIAQVFCYFRGNNMGKVMEQACKQFGLRTTSGVFLSEISLIFQIF